MRWLRPEFQNPDGETQQQVALEGEAKPAKKKPAKAKKQPWPKSLSPQAAAVQAALVAIAAPADEVEIAKRFSRASKDRIAELLETLVLLGRARELSGGKYAAASGSCM